MKLCKTCGETKPLEEYHRRKEGWYRSECKICWRIRGDRHKEAHQIWMASLKDGPCNDCGIQYPSYVMHWDHLPEFVKTMGLGKMRVKRLARQTILDEIAKCELVCANCHAERTYQRLSRAI